MACEDAGACRVSGGLDVAVRQARSDLILLAAPGLRLDAFALDRLGRKLAELGAGAASKAGGKCNAVSPHRAASRTRAKRIRR